ncbi:hypothetical protein [Neobacillus cucumis]|uniref:hypothetical protein n=1 Tax=Neobacillus cucumis TaxID=1740721 RepID=UPI001965D979|nr:hypothetical protein [Neobacillus cucumis]MBM7651682.1 arginine decarboxylase-like protein [Neobacillus cucumis]
MESILLMIVIGVISIIFRKSKNNQRPLKGKPTSQRLGDIQTMIKEMTDNISKDTIARKTEKKQAPLQSDQTKLEAEYLQVRQESEASRLGMSAARKHIENINSNEEINLPTTEDSDQRAVLNGIIWSEILSEPRSKKPYTFKGRSN